MDKRLVFNENVANYERYRPRYCDALFSDIISYAALTNDKHAVEIGCGTGQATEPILATGCNVTAIEYGEKLAAFVKKKFEHYPNFHVEKIAFETYPCENNKTDLVYAASSFHGLMNRLATQRPMPC